MFSGNKYADYADKIFIFLIGNFHHNKKFVNIW